MEAVRGLDYGRPSDRSVEGMLRERRGTCSTKHLFLAQVLAERFPALQREALGRVVEERLDQLTQHPLAVELPGVVSPVDDGIDLESSCENGICGACEQQVLAGIPAHCDSILTEEEQAENKRVMICCAGSKTERLVLDL